MKIKNIRTSVGILLPLPAPRPQQGRLATAFDLKHVSYAPAHIILAVILNACLMNTLSVVSH